MNKIQTSVTAQNCKNQFRKVPKGDGTWRQCKHCNEFIDIIPRNGINKRRIKHLEGCNTFQNNENNIRDYGNRTGGKYSESLVDIKPENTLCNYDDKVNMQKPHEKKSRRSSTYDDDPSSESEDDNDDNDDAFSEEFERVYKEEYEIKYVFEPFKPIIVM